MAESSSCAALRKIAIARTHSSAREMRALPRQVLQRDLQQFQARQVLGIDNTDWHIVVIDDDEIVNAMTLQQV
jgi:hypothetical protein